MKELEKKIEQRVLRWCKNSYLLKGTRRLPIIVTKLNLMGRRSWPDRCFWLPERPLLIEFKRVGETLTPLQKATHKILKGLGYEVKACTDSGRAIQFIRSAAARRGYRVEATEVYEARGKVRVKPMRGSVVPRSRSGKDKHHTGVRSIVERTQSSKVRTRNRTATRRLLRMAQ